MNVCLNAITFNPGKMGGVETYFRELVRHLPVIGSNDFFTVLTGNRYRHVFEKFQNLAVSGTQLYSRPEFFWLTNAVLRRINHLDTYSTALKKIKSDLIHHPFTTINPYVIDRPTVLTFWDMQHEFYPEFFTKKDLTYRARTYKKSTQQATRVIVSASFTKQCLIDRYGIDAGKIDVIHTGYSPIYKVLPENDETNRIRKKYAIDRSFMFYPAATWPHKNHGRLLEALKIMVDRNQFDGLLILSGIAMQHHNEVIRKINSSGLQKYVKILGYVPYSELPFMYNMARLLIFPSLFEGFGIPLVEAMACGCPVVASNCTSLPEVVGNAGKLFDPGSPEDIAAVIMSVWNSDSKLSLMGQKSLTRAKLFTWENTARKTLEVYHKAR